MFFTKNECSKCACMEICQIRDDVESFRRDLMNLEWYGGKKYVERECLNGIEIKVVCKNYIDKSKLERKGDKNE